MALQTNIHIGEKLNAEVLKQEPRFTWSNISWNFGNLGLCKWIMMAFSSSLQKVERATSHAGLEKRISSKLQKLLSVSTKEM